MQTLPALVLAATVGIGSAGLVAGGSVVGGPALSGAVLGGAALGGHGVIVNYAPGVRKLPNVKASAWVIADAGTGQVLAAKDPHGFYRPASTLKVLTAVGLIPVLNPDSVVTASKLAAAQEPNDIGLLAGHPYKVSDLFTALLTLSANDAGVALAEAAGGGSLARGMAIINAEAKRLQADDTVAVTPNGLDGAGQHISAYDLALIARQGLSMPAFMHYDTVRGGLFPVTAKKKVGLFNQNGLLTDYRGGIGGKIGWTSAAGATYVGMARRASSAGHSTTLIVSLLHCPPLTEIVSAEKLLDWGFAEDGTVQPAGTLVAPRPGSALPGSALPGGKHTAGSPQAGATLRVRSVSSQKRSAVTSASGIIAVTFSGVAILASAIAIGWARRQRSARTG